MKFTVSPEKGFEFAKICAELDGFVLGAQAMANHAKAVMVQQMAAQSPEPKADSPANPTP